jgi:hypothetical protein
MAVVIPEVLAAAMTTAMIMVLAVTVVVPEALADTMTAAMIVVLAVTVVVPEALADTMTAAMIVVLAVTVVVPEVKIQEMMRIHTNTVTRKLMGLVCLSSIVDCFIHMFFSGRFQKTFPK